MTKNDIETINQTDGILLFTDGACRGNQFKQNTGAWAFFYKTGNTQHSKSGTTQNTTNNKMELTALLEGLKTLSSDPKLKKLKISVFSDSLYLINGINIWSKNWIKKFWKGVENRELWQTILDLISQFNKIEFHHIAGHSGHEGNEIVDRLCNEEMDKL